MCYTDGCAIMMVIADPPETAQTEDDWVLTISGVEPLPIGTVPRLSVPSPHSHPSSLRLSPVLPLLFPCTLLVPCTCPRVRSLTCFAVFRAPCREFLSLARVPSFASFPPSRTPLKRSAPSNRLCRGPATRQPSASNFLWCERLARPPSLSARPSLSPASLSSPWLSRFSSHCIISPLFALCRHHARI